MIQAYLSDLAQHISLHPSCRAELRRHWPAPHYHKTPNDVFEEAEELLWRQCTEATSVPSSTTAVIGAHYESKTSRSAGMFNPYETFSLHLKRKRKKQAIAGSQRHFKDLSLEEQQQTTTETSLSKATRQISSSNLSVKSTSSARVSGAIPSTPRTSPRTRSGNLGGASAITANPAAAVDAKGKRATLSTSAASEATAAVKKTKGTSAPAARPSASASSPAKAATATVVAAPPPPPSPGPLASVSSQKRSSGAAAEGPSPPLSRAAAVTPSKAAAAKKESAAAPVSAAEDSGYAIPKRNTRKPKSAGCDASDTKPKRAGSSSTAPVSPRVNATTTSGSPRSEVSTKKKKTAGSSSSKVGSVAANSDSGSERRNYVRDPLHIRLPHNSPYRGRQATGRSGHHPVHVTVRWSGARQRRHRFLAQYPAFARLEREMLLQLPIRRAAPWGSSDAHEMGLNVVACEDDSYRRVVEIVPRQCFTSPRESESVEGSDAARSTGRSAAHPHRTVGNTSSDNAPHADVPLHLMQQLCSSDREANQTTTTAATERRASSSTASRPTAPHSHARMHGLSEDEEIVSCAVTHSSVINSSSGNVLAPRLSGRNLTLKSSTILSQSTTLTAARTSALGISGSELPTPSSIEHFPSISHCAACQPNSILIIRSPPQDYVDEAAACGSYYHSRQLGVAENANNSRRVMGPVNAHGICGLPGGVASAHSQSLLRVTYVTANTHSSTHALSAQHQSLKLSTDRGSNLSTPQSVISVPSCATPSLQPPQQHSGLRGVAYGQPLYSLNASGRNFSDPMASGHVLSNLNSPTHVNAATKTRGGVGDGGGAAHAGGVIPALQSPLPSFPSMPLFPTSPFSPAVTAPMLLMRSVKRCSSTSTSAGGGQEKPPPLSVKRVMTQRGRSFLLRQQHQQEGSSHAPPGDCAPVGVEYGTEIPPHPSHEDPLPLTADTVAFTPLAVHMASNLYKDSKPPNWQLAQALLSLAPPQPPPPPPPRASRPLDAAPGAPQLLGNQQATSAQHLTSGGEGADHTPRIPAQIHWQSSHFSVNSVVPSGTGESFQLLQQRTHPSHIEVTPTTLCSDEWYLHPLMGDEGGANHSSATYCSHASVSQVTQQYGDSSTSFMRCGSDSSLPETSLCPLAYTQARLYSTSESTAWRENTSIATVAATPVLSTMLAHGTPTGSCMNYLGNCYSPLFLEPQTSLYRSHQHNFTSLVRSHQRVSSCSLASTSFLSHPLVRTPSPGLARTSPFANTMVTSTASAPQVFCKYQRSDHQRRRHRLLPPLPGMRCPGMAGRLAFDAYRAAVHSGVITEEEECSYYLSHRRCTSARATPVASLINLYRQSAAVTPAPGSPLCVVSLADCHIRSPLGVTPLSTTDDGHNARARWDDEQEESSEVAVEREETTSDTLHCIYHIPRCCDDLYHRDEEALEMLSITTTSSCAFGAGLDGLCWKDWMPSSPVDAGEDMLRAMEQATSTAAGSPASSYARDSSRLSAIVHSSSRRSQDPLSSGPLASLPTPSATPAADSFSAASPTIAGAGAQNSTIAASSRQASSVFGNGGRVAPRNSDDLVCATCRALDPALTEGVSMDDAYLLATSPAYCDGGDSPLLQRHHRRQHSSTGMSSDCENHRSAPGSGKRAFIAEWIVSKLQKHMEKKKQKMQRKALEFEAATTTGKGGTAAGVGSTRKPRLDAGLNLLSSPTGALRGHSGTSSMSELSDICSPCGGNSGQLSKGSASRRQRLAYLVTAYQTERVIHEQKRREVEANHRELEALVHRSRMKMTPAAAAAGYYYEAHVVTSPSITQPLAQSHSKPFVKAPLKPATTSAATVAKKADAIGDGATRCSNKCASRTGEHIEDPAMEKHPSVSSQSLRVTAQGEAPPLRHTSKAEKGLANTMNPQRKGGASSSHAQTTSVASSSTATKRKLSDAAAPPLKKQQSEDGRRASKAPATASTAEAERMRAALDTLKKKKNAIKTWIRGLQR
ncbi:hypothetical_protein (plasmid) [Leishmania braziliensis MHOM/BR/75/M2904]|uniref:Hypothetical_protein n=2 Tax=Leishmania braziliensis TaxID=5660 RepID=A0A3P3YZS8_LEIBR|nr:unnamed protein product [Leishmania braziliensis]SYZ63489.1 hypothetical_protein [Leishmania braziliensis MHOM/BR/75/M2904]